MKNVLTLFLFLVNDTFYLEYSATPDANSSVSGSIENLSEVGLIIVENDF
jgi:hypothetical protein